MDIYRKYEALSPIYKGGLTNHLPMALVALKELGIDEEKIIEILDNYQKEKSLFDLTDKNNPIDDFNQEYINRTGFNLAALNHKGEDIVIGEFINKNKFTISSALFHGLIRLAYAKQFHHPLMIAQALAYFDVSSEVIQCKGTYVDEDKFNPAYDQLFKSFAALDYSFKERSSMEKLKEVLEHNLVKENLMYLRTPNREFILDFILSNYLRTEDFYILHLITGFEALLELEEYIYGFDDVLNHFFVLAQAFILFNTSSRIIQEQKGSKSLDELAKKVVNLKDVHELKLFFSLKKLDRLVQNVKITEIANRIFIK